MKTIMLLLLLCAVLWGGQLKFPADARFTIAPSATRYQAVEVKNVSHEAIKAIMIRWEFTRADTGYPDAENGVRYDPIKGTLLAPGTSEVFWTRLQSDMVKEGTEVNIIVDAIMFASGEIVGANTFGLDKHMKLRQDAHRYVAAEVVKRADHAELMAWLEKMAAIQPPYKSNSFIGGGAFWRATFLSVFAKEFLYVQNLGDKEMKRHAAAVLQERQ